MPIDHCFLRWWRENYFFCPLVPTLPQWLRWLTVPTFHVGITQVISDLFIYDVSSSGAFGSFEQFLTVHLDLGFVNKRTLFKPFRPFSIYERHIFLLLSVFFFKPYMCSDITPLNALNNFLFLYLSCCRSPDPQILTSAHLQTLLHV